MHRVPYMHGHVSGRGDIGWRRIQMRDRPGKMHIMRHLRQRLPGRGDIG